MPAGDDVALRSSPRLDALIALGVILATLLGLMLTGRDMGMVWDEGYTIARERLLENWFDHVLRPPFAGARQLAFSPAALDQFWPFSRAEPDGHPPFYALLGLAGWSITHRWLAPLAAYRFGPMVLVAITAGVIFSHLARRWGRTAGLVAAACLVLMPRIFAHAHYAHYDMPMTCLWLLAQMAFVGSVRLRIWVVPLGVFLGLAAGTKFTGIFAAAAPCAWVIFFEWWPRSGDRNRPGTRSFLVAMPIAALTLYAIQPTWWFAPVEGPWRYVVSNLTRHKTVRLATMYAGTSYGFALPWHNTIVLTTITTPVLIQILGVVGLIATVARRRRDPTAVVWPLSWLMLMVVRALPNVPGHDVVRLFLPSLASLAVLAGIGAGAIGDWCGRRWPVVVVGLLAVGECLVGIGRVYPYADSYYNAAFGGLKGAEKHGFELTYYWETAGPEFQTWVRDQAKHRPISLNFTMADPTLCNLWHDGELIPRSVPIDPPDHPDRPDYVQQRRLSFFFPEDVWLERHGHPTFVIRREGVDLLRVYPFDEWLAAVKWGITQPRPPNF